MVLMESIRVSEHTSAQFGGYHSGIIIVYVLFGVYALRMRNITHSHEDARPTACMAAYKPCFVIITIETWTLVRPDTPSLMYYVRCSK